MTTDRLRFALSELHRRPLLLVCLRCYDGRESRQFERWRWRWQRIECVSCGGRLVLPSAKEQAAMARLLGYLETVAPQDVLIGAGACADPRESVPAEARQMAENPPEIAKTPLHTVRQRSQQKSWL